MRVLLRAPLLTNSGYGVHSRQVFEWLVEKDHVDLDVECLKWGNTPWSIKGTDYNGLAEKIMERSRSLSKPYDLTFQLQLPDEWDPTLGNYNVGMSAFVETDRCNPAWVDACNKMDQVVVPSKFTKNVAKRSGILTSKICVIPEWYNHNIDREETPVTRLPEVRTKFNYLILGVLTAQNTDCDRKNIINTIKWVLEHHNNDKDVGIVIKTNLGRGSKKDKIETSKFIKYIVGKFRKTDFPKVYLVHGNMTSKEIAGLYKNKKISALITATRGEGYGLPIVEAAAAGIPIVATNWSGHLEFLKPGSFLPVDYNMKEIPESKVDERIFLKGFRWAEPTQSSFTNCLAKLTSNYKEQKEVANNLSEYVRENFSKQNIKKMYDNIFSEII